ncbi:HAMP domain-containing histidine kinase [Sphingomonas sanguinis]|uniref:sensor histidine kinase n=1 Tax=Sphingomonas sp. LC-1 TaxID=3110957 RepID=UPI0021BB9957|nr:HAMP domain-containing sensor histidine kinase [Sphingomonas sp. LC-1]MCT8000671.1 HAMP domain-containing histidine kinase [Sphingomonas sp. LC-1]
MTSINSPGESMVARAILDATDHLLSADPPIELLHMRAGGGADDPMAVAPVARIARLARRLGIAVSRQVRVADDEGDLDLWVQARPETGQIRLSVSGWRDRAAWKPVATPPDYAAMGADFRWETDAALRLTFLSREAGARHGFDPDAMLGRPLNALFAFDPSTGDGGVLMSGTAPLDGRCARLRPSDMPVRLSAAIRHDGMGGIAGLTGATFLIDQPGEDDDAARALAAQPPLTESFTAGLDRALRTPLARIVANADSIAARADGPIAADYAEYAGDIAHAGRHLIGLVDNLVELQAIEQPDFRLAATPIDLADVARRAAGLLGVRADSAGVTIRRPAIAEGMGAIGDFGRSLQILINLIGNALRYSPHGGEVVVSVEREDDWALVRVTDRGKGIALKDQPRIFEKFERVDPSEPGGNGLGLYIARRLARAMGGDLSVESEPGQGATFTFRLRAR